MWISLVPPSVSHLFLLHTHKQTDTHTLIRHSNITAYFEYSKQHRMKWWDHIQNYSHCTQTSVWLQGSSHIFQLPYKNKYCFRWCERDCDHGREEATAFIVPSCHKHCPCSLGTSPGCFYIWHSEWYKQTGAEGFTDSWTAKEKWR